MYKNGFDINTLYGKCLRVELVKGLDYGIVGREVELQLSYYVHFQTNTFVKGMNPLILPAMG